MKQNSNFTEGNIARPLIRFALPVLFAMCLQSLYGAVDLLVVGQFGTAADGVCGSYRQPDDANGNGHYNRIGYGNYNSFRSDYGQQTKR